jgi:DNA polymerase IV
VAVGRATVRAILHLDLDAFYASVEQLDDPSLKGRPVVVGGPSRRGVVCAASYEARRYGVRSAMPTVQARRLCPKGVFLPPRFERYGQLSDQVFGIYRRYTPLVEPLSLDEAFLDVTESRALHGDGRAIALAIKRSVREETGLTVSAGVADVKMASKIASDLGKPDGLVVVPEGGTAAFLAPLPVSRLWGVGRVTEAALSRLGVATIGDLARHPEPALVDRFGEHGRHMRALALGKDPRPVTPDEAAKSIGAEETFEEDLRGAGPLLPRLLEQSGRVARRLRAAGARGRTVTLKLKYADFTLVTRRCTLPAPTDDSAAIFEAVRAGLTRADLSRPVRLTGVSVSGFGGDGGPEQLGLFDVPAAAAGRRQALNAALDDIAERFGDGAVKPATLAGGEGPRKLRRATGDDPAKAPARGPRRGG